MRKPILVTGSHRSGTTWAGRSLVLAPNTAYIHEPFNIETNITANAKPFMAVTDQWSVHSVRVCGYFKSQEYAG